MDFTVTAAIVCFVILSLSAWVVATLGDNDEDTP